MSRAAFLQINVGIWLKLYDLVSFAALDVGGGGLLVFLETSQQIEATLGGSKSYNKIRLATIIIGVGFNLGNVVELPIHHFVFLNSPLNI